MAFLDYYRKERARHAALHATRCAIDDAAEAIHLLVREHEMPALEVVQTHGNRNSRYWPRVGRIYFNVDRLTWLTVIHEFAHALDHRVKLASQQYRPEDFQPPLRPRRWRWHSAHHAELVDILAKKIVERGWIEGIPAARLARENEKIARRERAAAMAADPTVIRAGKIEKRKAQVARLEATLKKCWVREKAITTRLSKAKRSLAALERGGKPEVYDDAVSKATWAPPFGADEPAITTEVPALTPPPTKVTS